MKGTLILALLVLGIIALSGCTAPLTDNGNTGNNSGTGDNGNGAGTGTGDSCSVGESCGTGAKTVNIEITSLGFSPENIEINAGDTVLFTNLDSSPHWPASDVHPTHGQYPEGGGCIGSAFDACKGLAEGETYSFTFDIKGSWSLHDHLHPNLTGKITVK